MYIHTDTHTQQPLCVETAPNNTNFEFDQKKKKQQREYQENRRGNTSKTPSLSLSHHLLVKIHIFFHIFVFISDPKEREIEKNKNSARAYVQIRYEFLGGEPNWLDKTVRFSNGVSLCAQNVDVFVVRNCFLPHAHTYLRI